MQPSDCLLPVKVRTRRSLPTACAARRGVSLLAILVSLLIVVLATVSVASTMVALRASRERDVAREDLAAANQLVDRYVVTIATSPNLKGTSFIKAREDLFKPAIEYYQAVISKHGNDKAAFAQLTDANYHLAGIYAKMGSKEAAGAMTQGFSYLNRMRNDKVDPATFPSLQQCALKYTMPTEWFTLRGVSASEMRSNLAPLIITVNGAIMTLEELAKENPDITTFRDDLAGIMRISGTLFGFANANQQAVGAWQRAADNLATLVRDRPNDLDYKIRYAEALNALASRQKSMGSIEESTGNYQKTLEVREQIAAANPDDKTRQQELTTAKRDLERVKAMKPAPKEAAAEATPAETPVADASAAPAADGEAAKPE